MRINPNDIKYGNLRGSLTAPPVNEATYDTHSHDDKDYFGAIFAVVNSEIRVQFEIQYGDLKTTSNYNEYSVFEDSFSECELDFLNEEMFEKIEKLNKERPYGLVIYTYQPEEVADDKYQQIYFGDDVAFDLSQTTASINRKVHFSSWDYIVEEGTIPEHTKYYDHLPSNTDDEGTKTYYKPEDFNFIKKGDRTFSEMMHLLYNDNIINPVFRMNGNKPTTQDLTRRPIAMGDLIIHSLNYDTKVTINEQKGRTLHSFRRTFSKALLKDGHERVYHCKPKLNFETNLLDIHYRGYSTIRIDKYDKEHYVASESYEYDSKDGIKNMLVVDSNQDSFIKEVRHADKRSNEWKYFEGIGQGSGDIGEDPDNPNPKNSSDYLLPLQQQADQAIEDGEDIESFNIELASYNFTLFKDIHAGQLVEIVNFTTVADGLYRVDQMSAVIEQTYTSYKLDKLTRIGDL